MIGVIPRLALFVLYHRLDDLAAMTSQCRRAMTHRTNKIDIPGGASRAVDQKNVTFSRFEVQKNINGERVKCLYENGLARVIRSCCILPHIGQERQDAALRMADSKTRRQKLAPKNPIFPVKTPPTERPVLAKTRIPRKNG
jgi:hypothetical protein